MIVPIGEAPLLLGDGKKTVALEFTNLSFETVGKTILNGVSGFALPGQVIAIMGPSGAGN